MLRESFQGISREFQGSVKDCFKEVSRMFKESVKCVSRKFHKKVEGCFKNVSRKFILQFCFCMALIAATRAEGRLVIVILSTLILVMQSDVVTCRS